MQPPDYPEQEGVRGSDSRPGLPRVPLGLRGTCRRVCIVTVTAALVTAAGCGAASTMAAGRHTPHVPGHANGSTTTSTDAPAAIAGKLPAVTTTAPSAAAVDPSPPSSTTPVTGTGTSSVAPTSTHGPLTSPPLPMPGPGFVPGHVTAVGDSVMLDYQTALEQDVPGIDVQAAVSRQWTTGVTILQQELAAGQLGSVVVVGLGTNGPVTVTDFNSMMSVLSGASRVVFVNVFVDRPWQDPNNAVLAAGVAQHANAVLADWYTLASQHTTWLYPTQTHLPIGGPGAQALAALVAGAV